MHFHDFTTTYDIVRRQGLAPRSVDEFYREALAVCISMARCLDRHRGAVEYNRSICERDWLRLGRPYFKVFPAMIPLLSNVSVDVPVEYLRPPFAAFVIRFPTEQNPMVVDGEYHVRSVLLAEGRPDGDEDDRRMYLWIDLGERDPDDVPILTYCQLACEPGLSIEDAFSRLPTEPDTPGLVVPRELQARCLRIAVSVSFLATYQDRLVVHDVTSRDLVAYIEARKRGDGARMERIEQRAVRRGKLGWNVRAQEPWLRPLISHTGRNVSVRARRSRPARASAPAAGSLPGAAHGQGDVRAAGDREARIAPAAGAGGVPGEVTPRIVPFRSLALRAERAF